MGLFRRGTKLLRLGSGLRDCCCRPANPEECWCPDRCSYYWELTGPGFSQERMGVTCRPIPDFFDPTRCLTTADSSKSADLDNISSYGLITDVNQKTDSPWSRHPQTSVGWQFFSLRFSHSVSGVAVGRQNFLVDLGVFDRPFVRDPFVGYGTVITFSAYAICPKEPQDLPLWQIGVDFDQQVDMSDGSDERSLRVTLLLTNFYARFTVPAQCITDSALWCCPPADNRPALHVPYDLELTIGNEGVTALGTLYEWSGSTISPLYTLSTDFYDQLGDEWKTDEYPLFASNQSSWLSATLKQKPFCRAGDCDCNQSLTGMTVTFEGKTFTYGTLESITEGVDTWEQVVTGLFRRITRETCNGNYVASVKTADISCQTIDGDDFWVVFLGSECYERDEATCPAADDARRVMQWTGVFTCGPDGQPSGSPHSATNVDGPPDLDSNTTVGTPAAECAADSDIPAISLG